MKNHLKKHMLTLWNVEKDIYFWKEMLLTNTTKFFSKKNLVIGGGGYQPKPLYKIMSSKDMGKTYDGLIL
jgi:erythromycin esterase